MADATHKELIVDQFSKQAIAFSTAKTIADEKALQLLIDSVGAGPDDTVLDVACGGGNVVCAFARVVRHATGIDMTPAMLDRARIVAREKSLSNVIWDQGQATSLPYADGTFTIVVTRFSFHHFIEPLGRSFPNPGDDEKIREIFRTSARDDRLGIPIRLEGTHVHYAYPVAVLAATRP